MLGVGAASIHREPAAPQVASAEAAPAPRNIALDRLHRLTGDAAIPPSDDVQRAAAGTTLAVVVVRLCLDADGKVASTRIVKPSGVRAYDDQLQAAIQASWTFGSELDGKPGPVCTTATFVNH